jgi:hypothetical protein
MREYHSATAISLEAQCRKCVAFILAIFKKLEVGVPFVADDLAAGEAADLGKSDRHTQK